MQRAPKRYLGTHPFLLKMSFSRYSLVCPRVHLAELCSAFVAWALIQLLTPHRLASACRRRRTSGRVSIA